MVSITRLDRQLVCKKCGTEFYVTRTGGAVIAGKRPKKFVDPLVMTNGKIPKPDFAERWFHYWGRLSRQRKQIIKLALLAPFLLLILVFFVLPMLRPAIPIPATLPARATMLVKALFKRDMEKLSALTSPDTQADLAKWVDAALPSGWPDKLPILPIKSVSVLFQEVKQKRAGVEVEIEDATKGGQAAPPPPPPPELETASDEEPAGSKGASLAEPEMPAPADDPKGMAAEPASPPAEVPTEGDEEPEVKIPKPPPTILIRLFWKADGSGGWLFDASDSLKKMSKSGN